MTLYILWHYNRHLTNSKQLFLIAVITEEPEFTEVIENVTVPAGRNVKLACSVKNLGSFKVKFRILKFSNPSQTLF